LAASRINVLPIELASIQIQSAVLREMIEHARVDPRLECCGLLAGRENQITHSYPAENVAINPSTSYEVSTKEIVNLTRLIRESRLDLLGIYHSHPNEKEEPSETDITAAGYPDAAYFIISRVSDQHPQVRAFLIHDGQVSELNLRIV
jgi:[CysO sulfur-carrier protein]-S-L-cysteine hydrolase